MQIMPHGTDVKNAAYIGDISMKGYISFVIRFSSKYTFSINY